MTKSFNIGYAYDYWTCSVSLCEVEGELDDGDSRWGNRADWWRGNVTVPRISVRTHYLWRFKKMYGCLGLTSDLLTRILQGWGWAIYFSRSSASYYNARLVLQTFGLLVKNINFGVRWAWVYISFLLLSYDLTCVICHFYNHKIFRHFFLYF